MKRTIVLSALIASAATSSAYAKDIYVSSETGKNENAGTAEAPIKFLWKAIQAAQEGDTIHVAKGNYPGEGKSGCQPKIEKNNLKIMGGYASDFKSRDPFSNSSVVMAPDDSMNKCRLHTFYAERADNNLTGVVIDGFVIDRGSLNTYKQPPNGDGSQDNSRSPNGATAIWLVGKGGFEARNNVILNSAYGGIYVKAGKDSVVSNNIVFSTIGRSIEAIAGSGWGKPKMTIENNTSVFSYKFSTTEGRGLLLDNICTYEVKNNLFAFNDESGVALKFPNPAVNLSGNLFFMNKYGDHVTGGQGGKRVLVADFGDELTQATGNTTKDLSLPISKEWQGKWFSRVDAAQGGLTMDAVNQYRSAHGLPLQGGAGKSAVFYAVRYPAWQDIVKLAGFAPQGAQKIK